ncbi:response regulator [Fibrella sp. ES10-3-2-2]
MDTLTNASSRPVVFVTDESAEYRQLVRHVFTCFLPEYELRLFENGRALQRALIGEDQPGLIVIGASSPVTIWCELIMKLRETARYKNTPVVLMSSTNADSDVSACYGAGANSYMVKPENLEAAEQLLPTVCTYWFKLHQQSLITV